MKKNIRILFLLLLIYYAFGECGIWIESYCTCYLYKRICEYDSSPDEHMTCIDINKCIKKGDQFYNKDLKKTGCTSLQAYKDNKNNGYSCK